MITTQQAQKFREDYQAMLLTLLDSLHPKVINAILLNAGNRTSQQGTKTYALLITEGAYVRDVSFEIGKLLYLKIVFSEMRNTGLSLPHTISIFDVVKELSSLLYGRRDAIKVHLQPLPYEE